MLSQCTLRRSHQWKAALIIAVFLAMLLAPFSICRATNFYASTSGSTGNDGLTTGTPWPLDYALSHAGASNTIIVLPGNYTGNFQTGSPWQTIVSQNKWGARLIASTLSLPVFSIYNTGNTNCVLDGFEITGSSTASGVYVVANNSTVQNNWIHHNGTNTVSPFSGIEAHDLTGTIIRNNLCEYNGGGPLGHGIYMNGTNCVVAANVLRYNGGGGLQFYRDIGQNSNEGSLNPQIFNNLIYGNLTYALIIGSQFGREFYCYNNTIIQTNGTSLFYVGQTSPYAILDLTNNILEYTGCPFTTGPGTIQGGNNQTNVAMGFVNPSKGIYWLSAGSAAIGAANTSIVPSTNFFGSAQASITDIGFVQYNAAYAFEARTLDPSPATGADYWGAPTTNFYASTTGSSGNNGLATNTAWPLDYALSHAGPSNTVLVLPGTYTGNYETGSPWQTVRSLTKWGARLVASTLSLPPFSIYNSGKTNCVLDGFEITGSSTAPGVYVVADNATVENNWIHHNGTNVSTPFSGIEAHDLSGTLVLRNLCEYNGGGPLGHGIYLNGTNCSVIANVLRYNGGSGLQFYRDIGQNANEGSLNPQIFDNLVYGNITYGIVIGSQFGREFYCYNNTIIQTNGTSLFYVGQTSPYAVLDLTNNILAYSGCSFTTGSGTIQGDHNQTNAAMGYVNAPNGLYWLSAGSAAIGAANTAIVPSIDFFGNAQSSVADIGFVQYKSAYTNDGKVLDPSTLPAPDYWGLPATTFIDPTNRIDWVPGLTVGVRGGIPTVNTIFTNFYSTNTCAEINYGISVCPSNQVVMLPDTSGVYDISTGLTVDKSGVVVRGMGSNTTLYGHITFGHSSSTVGTFGIASGGNKGSTNIVLLWHTNAFNESVSVGDLLSVTAFFSHTNPNFPVISVAGYNSTIRQPVIVMSVGGGGNNLTIWPPLVFDFTNNPTCSGLNESSIGSIQPRQRSGLESFTLISTNATRSDNQVFMLRAEMLSDSWMSNVNIMYPNNYSLDVEETVMFQLQHCDIGYSLSQGTSHSGVILAMDSGALIQDNIIHDVAQLGIMFNDGFCGNASFANFSTNNNVNGDVLMHNTHPMMNLWEGNIWPVKFIMDGYFGSASHQTLFRNYHPGSMAFKRWITYMQVVGNVIGQSGVTPLYLQTNNNFSTYPVFDIGFPNIGNNTYISVSPDVRKAGAGVDFAGPSFTWPGSTFNDYNGVPLTNGFWTFTNTQVATTNLVGIFTNIPSTASINPQNYPLRFQDPVNTNVYWPQDGTIVLPYAGGTVSNLFLTAPFTVSNGWTLYLAGQIGYQSFYPNEYTTELLHGNLVYTNAGGTVVWDPTVADRSLPSSILYPNGAPPWWGTNRWPAVDPFSATPVATIPAQDRFNGIYLIPDPAISAYPQPQTVFVGQDATFTVTASGNTTLSYQWKFNGSNVGANSSAYTRTSCQLADNGASVYVVVTDTAGSATSATASLTVIQDPLIVVEPQSQTVAAGSNATFMVTATGATTLSYQWKFGGTVVGSNSSAYTRVNCQPSDSGGSVQVTVSDTAGSVSSGLATLTVTGGVAALPTRLVTAGRGVKMGRGVRVVSTGWYDSTSPATADGTGYSSGSSCDITSMASPVSGTCDKIRVYVGSVVNSPLHIKMALYASDHSTLLGSGICTLAASPANQNQYYECPITPVPVTFNATYWIGFECEYGDGTSGSSAHVTWKYRSGQPANSSYYKLILYGSFPPSPFGTPDGSLTYTYVVGMHIF